MDGRQRRRADDHPHVRRRDAGRIRDDELRQLVRVLPHAHPGGEDGDVARVQGARRDKYRVGFHTLFNADRRSSTSPTSTAAQKTAWFDAAVRRCRSRSARKRRSLDAIVRIGEYYKNGTQPAAGRLDRPDRAVVPEELAHVLHRRLHQPERAAHDRPWAIRTIDPMPDVADEPVPGLTPGHRWPAPLSRGRRSARCPTRCPTTRPTTGSPTCARPVAAADQRVRRARKDPASWQHLNFAALSLGTDGQADAGNQSVTESQLAASTLQWPKPIPRCSSPTTRVSTTCGTPPSMAAARFVNAQSADEVKLGIGKILADIVNQSGARAGVGFQSVNLAGHRTTSSTATGFEPGWGGTLTKIQIDPDDRGRHRRGLERGRRSSMRSCKSRSGCQGHAVVHRAQDRHH